MDNKEAVEILKTELGVIELDESNGIAMSEKSIRFKEALKLAIAALQWVSVEDGLPKQDGEYLTIDENKKKRVVECKYRQFPQFLNPKYAAIGENKYISVTHYMPLPPTP